jgi:hypothetical protein
MRLLNLRAGLKYRIGHQILGQTGPDTFVNTDNLSFQKVEKLTLGNNCLSALVYKISTGIPNRLYNRKVVF